MVVLREQSLSSSSQNTSKVIALFQELNTLTVFRGILKDECLFYFSKAFQGAKFKEHYFARAVSLLLEQSNGSLTEHLKNLLINYENFYIKKYSQSEKINDVEQDNFERDIHILNSFANSIKISILQDIENEVLPNTLPTFDSNPLDFEEFYENILKNSIKNGYGMWATHNMFMLADDGQILPVDNYDEITTENLYEYEREKQILHDNTLALVNGKIAQNVLLTGDAGCGKSSSVKAIANEFKSEGLRIIEVKKNQMQGIPKLLDKLQDLNLHFIIFIDDVSFTKGDENYNALKALLEGSLAQKSHNTVIYATSNRRHLIAEKFSDRDGDDLHVSDTIQEQISLSDRFGIHITFSRPNKDTYLKIVEQLADEKGLGIPNDELFAEAEKFALTRGGRSARTAKQFVEMKKI